MWYDPRNVMATIGIAILLAAGVAAYFIHHLIHHFLDNFCC